MNDLEKSAFLMKARGWAIGEPRYSLPWVHASIIDEDGLPIDSHLYPLISHTDNSVAFDLYAFSNMALAWKIHIWATTDKDLNDHDLFIMPYEMWFDQYEVYLDEEAQRRWLDKIIELLEKENVAV